MEKKIESCIHFWEIKKASQGIYNKKKSFYSQSTFPSFLQVREVEKLRLTEPSHYQP